MGIVAGQADRVLVMYAGKVVECGTVREIFTAPLHPYTRMLLASIPRPDRDVEVFPTIEGRVPPPDQFPEGCRFCTRCPFRRDRCAQERPPERGEGEHRYLCHFAREEQELRR